MKNILNFVFGGLVLSFLVNVAQTFVLYENVTVTFPTPIEELERIQKQCEDKGVPGWDKVKEKHRNCLAKLGVGLEEEIERENVEIVKFYCDNLPERRSCWEEITQKIDECIPTRGQTVRSIYTAFLETTCKNEEQLHSLKVSGKLCPVQATISKSCRDFDGMTSHDLCKSFTAQKRCEESDYISCKHEEHKELLQKNFKEIGHALGCDENTILGKSSARKLIPAYMFLKLALNLIYTTLKLPK